jgi:hypothetical protein
MHICGASCHAKFPDRRETGIIEEILLENKYRNPEHSYALFDALLWEKVTFQKNLSVLLNTHMTDAKTEGGLITRISACQLTTEKRFEAAAKIFIDCTGDGTLAYKAGAEYMFGREDKRRFGEPFAVSKADGVTMGNSVMFKAVDAGRPVPYKRPFWANDYSGAPWAKNMKWVEITSGYWWIEAGGTRLNCLTDAEEIKNELLKIVFGVWDYIKNSGDKRAENLALDWVGTVPAKRETRRIVGDYILNENDLTSDARFDDCVGYGGWHIDAHPPERFLNCTVNNIEFDEDITRWPDGVYQIPFRSLYSKDIDNLMLGGRIISASHRAFASTRVMGTCAVLGQAAGTAAAMAANDGVTPRSLATTRIKELQQKLLKDDCYIPNVANRDVNDAALNAAVSCSAEIKGCEALNVIKRLSFKLCGEQIVVIKWGLTADRASTLRNRADVPPGETLVINPSADTSKIAFYFVDGKGEVRTPYGCPEGLEFTLGGVETVPAHERAVWSGVSWFVLNNYGKSVVVTNKTEKPFDFLWEERKG